MSFNLCILDLKKGTKKLKYRGVSYPANFTSMVTAKRKLQEQAERQSDQLGDSSIICLRPNIQLIYRGIPYYLNRQLERKGKFFLNPEQKQNSLTLNNRKMEPQENQTGKALALDSQTKKDTIALKNLLIDEDQGKIFSELVWGENLIREEDQHQNNPIATAVNQWRQQPGYISHYGSQFESIHILLGQFIADRHSPSPLPECNLLRENATFEWSKGYPLEKVINSQFDLEALLLNPQLFRNAVAIIEPWEHVGYNPIGEHVRASLNVAYILQKIADCDSILFPIWSSENFDIHQLMGVLSSSLAIVMEGGDPSVRDASTFTGSNTSHENLIRLTEAILLSRTPASAPALFICLGHQLAAQAHISLIKRAVKEVLALESLEQDAGGKVLRHLQRVCREIQAMGESLVVKKRNGRVVAEGWDDPEFAVSENEAKEIGARQLQRYNSPDAETSSIPEALIWAHEVTADIHEGIIDTSIAYQRNLNIVMFDADAVNEEAVLFANWAYRLFHEALIPCRHIIANSPLSWIIRLPDALEILCSTIEAGEVVTECSATCINYQDFETREIRRSFTCQFHPELLADLRVVGMREPLSYEELKTDDGARLFARLLYAGMHE